jgi:DNA invertase Pin-like site-specific DNA recombinase
MLIGYSRVSTQDQNLQLQQDALKEAKCERIFEDKMSGAKADRPGLRDAIAYARPGDTIVIWKLSRLSRSLKQLIETVQLFEERQIHLKSINESLDTSTPTGKLLFHIIASFAQFERDNLVETTKAGLVAARARGKLGGRPRKLDAKKVAQAKAMYQDRNIPVTQICDTLGISRATFYNYVKGEPTAAGA